MSAMEIETNIDIEQQGEDVPDVPQAPRGKGKRKRKDTDDKEVKKVRKTLGYLYPKVKVQPRTAYMFFMREVAKRAREEEGSEKLDTRAISKLWKETSEEDRQPYLDMAKEDKERFFNEARELGYEVKDHKKNKKPTKPCSAYLLFSKDKSRSYMEEHGVSYQDSLKALGVIWRELPKEERQPYEDEAARLKQEIEQRLINEEIEAVGMTEVSEE